MRSVVSKMNKEKTVRPRGTDSARIIKVIETKSIRGYGTEIDLCREVTQYWSLDGELLAENDPCAINNKIQNSEKKPTLNDMRKEHGLETLTDGNVTLIKAQTRNLGESMEKKVWYLCDGEKPDCKKTACYKNTEGNAWCRYTSDINHAVNFSRKVRGNHEIFTEEPNT